MTAQRTWMRWPAVVGVAVVFAVLTTAPGGGATAATASKTLPAWRTLAVPSTGLAEVSGCAFSRRDPNQLWLHNDSGGGPVVVPVNITTGSVGTAVTLSGIDVIDTEDIAMTSGGDLVLADIGDNAKVRSSVQLYRFREPKPGATTAVVTTFDLRYPDGPRDAEALVVAGDGRTAMIITKERSGVAGAYAADLRDTKAQTLTLIGRVRIVGENGLKPNQITAADAFGSRVVVRTYQRGYAFDAPRNGTITDAVRASPRRFSLPLMIQAEALCVSPDGTMLATASESRGAPFFALAIGPMPA